MTRRPSICLLSFGPLASDGRVLRQVTYLADRFDLTVGAFGAAPALPAGVRFVRVGPDTDGVALRPLAARLRRGDLTALPALLAEGARRASRQPAALLPGSFLLRLGHRLPALYPLYYAPPFRGELARLLSEPHDAFHANDWATLPAAARAARRHGARLVVDLHEFAPLEFENEPDWWLHEPMIRHALRRHAARADAVITVAPEIAARYRADFGFDVQVVLNTPDRVPVPAREPDPGRVELVHHGIATRVRNPEAMIAAVARCDPRYRLHFMLLPNDYVPLLRAFADRVAPGRVFFHDPVPPAEIVPTIARFDVGFSLIAPTSFNYRMCLPNKFFEALAAGLAVCTGPSPAMARLVGQFGCGVVAPSFEPADLAAALNDTTPAAWAQMRRATRLASEQLCAEVEMRKLVSIYERLLGPGEDNPASTARAA